MIIIKLYYTNFRLRFKCIKILKGIIQPRTTTLHLRPLHRNVVIICLTYFAALGILEKIFSIVFRTNLWNRIKELKVPFELRVVMIRIYEKAISKFKKY